MKNIKSRLYQVANLALVAAVGRRLPVFHLVEHPKCGGSWIRNMMQHYIGGEPYLGDRIVTKNTVIQVHRLYSHIYCNPVIVFRDPRDVFVSFYYHERRMIEQGLYPSISRYYQFNINRAPADDFAAYLQAKLGHRTDPGFSYSKFVDSWLDRKGSCSVLYENALEDTARELARIVRFLDFEVDPEKISEITDYHSFEHETMRRYGVARKPGTEDAHKFQRKGISGDWRNHFNERSCELIHEYEWSSIQRLGYEKDESWIDRFIDN